MVDTVENALATPDSAQPWAALGLREGEYARIREVLGRRPTGCELALYAVLWSEHCSDKSSKVHLRRFAALGTDTPRGPVLVGTRHRAGVVDIGGGLAVTLTIGSHHPSLADPHQGAATGVGCIVRDTLALGARPIALLDALRLGPLDAPDTARVLPGMVAGVGGQGNGLGVPTIGGETVFDEVHLGSPLVNAVCVGVLRPEDVQTNRATGAGNRVVLYGAATGGDGTADTPLGRLLVECTLELVASGLVVALQGLGAAGLACATSEMASAGDGGLHIDLDKVALRDPALSPEEVLTNASPERMVAIVRPADLDAFSAVCARWGVPATDIGEVIPGDRLHIDHHGRRVVDVDPRTVTGDCPVDELPLARPHWIDALNADRAEDLPRAASGEELREQVLRLVGSPNLCDRGWITDQYDRHARGDTVLAQPEDAGMVRLDEASGLGIALSTDNNPRFCLLNPYLGAQLALGEGYRNVATTGAQPVAVTDGLNVGSPRDPDVMWQLQESVMGLVDGCLALGTPVTGGTVGFHHRADGRNIHPTPVVGMLGVIDDVSDRTPMGFAHPGDAIVVLGHTREELSGSAWADVVHGHLGGMPPMPHLADEKVLGGVMTAAARQRLLSSAHDLSEGGLAQGLVESCLRNDLGAALTLPEGDPTVWLFSESPARVLVSVSAQHYGQLGVLCAEAGVPLTRLGEVVDQPGLEVLGQFTLPLVELRARWEAPIREAVGGR